MDDLLRALDLTAAGPDRFEALSVASNLRQLFGGQVLAQALVAAARTVEADKSAHSLHAYFLRAGNTREPIHYTVERVRDGRRLACRAVSALQGGKKIATVLTSFAGTSGGVEHRAEPPSRPEPEELPTLVEAAERWGGLSPVWSGFGAIDIRVAPAEVQPAAPPPARAEDSGDLIWQRAAAALPDAQVLHQAVLLYMSDIMLLAAALVPHGVPIGDEGDPPTWDGLSLDHAIWFHRPIRADQWLLFAQRSPFAGGGRSLSTCEVFDREGNPLATVAQEGLIIDVADSGSAD